MSFKRLKKENKMGNLIYKVKDNIDINVFGRIGYDLFPETNNVVIKFVEQDIKSDIVQGTLRGIYQNKNWKEQFYDKYEDRIKEIMGLRYNKKGKAILTKKFKEYLVSWRIQIDFDDRWIGFTSADPFDHNIYYAKQVLDTYCETVIKDLLEKDLIEVIEVE